VLPVARGFSLAPRYGTVVQVSRSSPHPGTHAEQPLLQQAPVHPLDASGFTASVVGTAGFAATSAVFWLADLDQHWAIILTTGTGLGLILTAYTAWHKRRARRRGQAEGRTGSGLA
jgi:hypothetical protein